MNTLQGMWYFSTPVGIRLLGSNVFSQGVYVLGMGIRSL